MQANWNLPCKPTLIWYSSSFGQEEEPWVRARCSHAELGSSSYSMQEGHSLRSKHSTGLRQKGSISSPQCKKASYLFHASKGTELPISRVKPPKGTKSHLKCYAHSGLQKQSKSSLCKAEAPLQSMLSSALPLGYHFSSKPTA